MMRFLHSCCTVFLLIAIGLWALPVPEVHAQELVNCIAATNTPCSSSVKIGTGNQGDPAWRAFGKMNDNFEGFASGALPTGGPIFLAKGYGTCTWDASHDVGSCINSAIAAAASAHGGEVLLPCGTYGLTTQVLNQTSGVHLQGCGVGITRDSVDSSHFLAVTRLLWIGGSTAQPALLIQTASGGGIITYSANVWGVTVDCANLCGIAIEINGVDNSFFDIGGAEATSINIEFTTPTDLEGSGNQGNEIWAYSRSTSSSNSPTGILFDAGCSGCFNTSYNIMHVLSAWYNKGDGIVFGGSDNNLVERINDNPQPSATGSPVVFANSAYTPPNGVPVNQRNRAIRVLHDGSHGMHVTGFQTGSTFTAAGGNGGTAALNPTTIATVGSAAASTSMLTFASTTGVLNEESMSCGGPVNGVFNGTPVGNVTSTTINFGVNEFVNTVPNNTNCTFTYGIRVSAVAGTYTLTATDSTHYTLTAPAGGHTQSGITVAGGFLTFTDIIIPWTGTPNTNDSWTIVVPTAVTQIAVEYIDKENARPAPTYEVGASGYTTRSGRGYPVLVGQTCVIGSSSAGTAAGVSSCSIGGEGNSASGEASAAIAGTGTTASGFGALATGQNDLASGADSFVMGKDATDRGRFAAHCVGGALFSVQGDNQTCLELLAGTGATGSAIRLTSNKGAASSTNCINPPNNAAYALTIDIVAFDTTTVSKFASWNALTGLLTRGANAAATALAVASATPAATYSGGTLTGNSMSLTADTSNGCLNISWTPPTSNTDTWKVVATVRTVETQQ